MHCVICGKHGKFGKPKISNLLEKIFNSFYYLKQKLFKEEELINILKVLGLIENI